MQRNPCTHRLKHFAGLKEYQSHIKMHEEQFYYDCIINKEYSHINVKQTSETKNSIYYFNIFLCFVSYTRQGKQKYLGFLILRTKQFSYLVSSDDNTCTSKSWLSIRLILVI